MSQQCDRAKSGMGSASLEKLSEDLLYRIVHLLGLHDKIRLQLVSKKLYAALMRAPPGEGLWGYCDLTETFSNFVAQDGCIDPGARRWLIKRVPYMKSIKCIVRTEKAAGVLHGLLPGLSTLIAPGTELDIELDKRRTLQLLHSRENEPPSTFTMEFWWTTSHVLTGLSIDVDWTRHHMVLQTQILSRSAALTSLKLRVTGGEGVDVLPGDILSLSRLRNLDVEGYWGRHLVLECPRLRSLVLTDCDPMGCVSLQAPFLQHLCARSSGEFPMHPGFPMSNFSHLGSLSIECPYEEEEQLFQVLPIMQKLHSLDLGIFRGSLLQSLPESLEQVTLHYHTGEAWHDAVIPLVQRLPQLQRLEIRIQTFGNDRARLCSDLRPFLAMQKLRHLQLGNWQAWSPASLRALGQFEAELARSGSKIELEY